MYLGALKVVFPHPVTENKIEVKSSLEKEFKNYYHDLEKKIVREAILYKKYRPKDWNGIIGQDSAVKQIREAIKNNRVPTAYSFSGPAGTGKTSIAKVIAKTLNCPNVNEDLQPCNECSTCKAIDSDTLIGVQYFSMANNGEVDNVRRIVQDAQTKVAIKKKVIIIDEYHNLSPKGFDALLIPLEKDNMNALFIFCTTELDKIRPAVLSRTQNISLKPVKQKELAKNLIEIAKKENLPIDKEAILYCAKKAKGSVRTSISLFEKYINSGELETSKIDQCIEHIIFGETTEVISTINEMGVEGENFNDAIASLYEYFTFALQEVSGVTTNNEIATKISKSWTGAMILKALTMLGDAVLTFNHRQIDAKLLFEIPALKLSLMAKQQKIKRGTNG